MFEFSLKIVVDVLVRADQVRFILGFVLINAAQVLKKTIGGSIQYNEVSNDELDDESPPHSWRCDRGAWDAVMKQLGSMMWPRVQEKLTEFLELAKQNWRDS